MSLNNSPLFNANKAANHLGLSKSTLAKMRLSGSGPVYSKLGRRVVYRASDLDDWISANRHQSTSEYATPKPGE